ncbi:hypothetical protein Tco_0632386 [Tanacetum coccineum]
MAEIGCNWARIGPSKSSQSLSIAHKWAVLNDNRTLIRKYPETFLCLVGLSRSFVEMDLRPTLLGHDKNDMGLLDFVKFADSFKVKTRERTLADGEVPLLIESANMVVAPSNQTIRLLSHAIADEIKDHAGKRKRKVGLSADELLVKKVRSGGVIISEPNPTTAGKSSAALRRLELQSGQPDVGVGFVHHPTEEFVSSSVTLTPEHEGYEDSGSPHDGSVRTRRASERYVVLTSSSEHGDDDDVMRVEDVDVSLVDETVNTYLPENDVDAASLTRNRAGTSSLPGNEAGTSSSVPNDGSPVDDFYESQTIYSSKAQDIYVPNWDVTNDARMDDRAMCRNLVDHLPPLGYWAFLRNRSDAEFLDLVNVNSAQHACMVSEDAEIADLKSRLGKAEGEAAEVSVFRSQVSGLETAAAAKAEELANLSRLERHGFDLDARLSELCCQVDFELYPHLLIVVARRRWVIGHGLRLAFMKCCKSAEYQTALAKVISLAIGQGIQQGLVARVEHGKAGRKLSVVAAYDPGVKARYEEAVGELENISLPFLDHLESYKDVPLDRVMASLCLESFPNIEDETPEFCRLQHVLEQVTVPIYYERGGSRVPGMGSSSDLVVTEVATAGPDDRSLVAIAAPLNALVVADSQISSLAIVDNIVSTVEPHDDLFDATVLDKPVDS